MWSQSNLATDALAGLMGDQIAAEQEIWYALRSGGSWGVPVQLTSDMVSDDSPELVSRSDGSVVSRSRLT